MDAKFLVELPSGDEVYDLVTMMARFAGVEFRLVWQLETRSEALARSVATLAGREMQRVGIAGEQPVVPASVLGLAAVARAVEAAAAAELPTAVEMPAAGRFEDLPRAVQQEMAGRLSAGEMAAVVREGVPAEVIDPDEIRRCKYCGKIIYRGVVCTAKACRSEAQRVYDANWKARKKAEAECKAAEAAAAVMAVEAAPAVEAAAEPEPAGASGAEEVAPGEASPFAGRRSVAEEVMYTVGNQAMTFREIQSALRTGEIQEGTRVQARPSGRFYQVRRGRLEKAQSQAG